MENNPYSTPQADLDTNNDAGETNDQGMFSFSGRIGRVRYLAYLMVWYLIFFFVLGVAVAVLLPMIQVGEVNLPVIILGIVGVIGYIVFVMYAFVYAVRRLNDSNRSGWLSVLMIVPFVNILIGFYLLFAPGTPGHNTYGAPARPNHAGIYIGAFAPFILIGLLAGVAVPAYDDYLSRSEQAQLEQSDSYAQLEQLQEAEQLLSE